MPRRVPLLALPFVACLVGSIYVAVMVGCFAHELLGHGLAAVALGGKFRQFQVDPAAHGWAYYLDVPARLDWVPLWAGIAVNLIFGLVAVVVSNTRSFNSPHVALAVVLVAVAHTGQAIGYALQGAVSGAGDAAALATDLRGWPHAIVIGLLAVAYLLLFDWTLRRFVVLVDQQFSAADRRSRRRWFAGTVLLPFAVLMVARPASVVFSPTVDWSSRGALLLIVGAGGMWRCRAPIPAEMSGRSLGWRGAVAWVLGAVAIAAIAGAWTSKGVYVDRSPSEEEKVRWVLVMEGVTEDGQSEALARGEDLMDHAGIRCAVTRRRGGPGWRIHVPEGEEAKARSLIAQDAYCRQFLAAEGEGR